MNTVEQNLANWKQSLLLSIPVGGLLARNSIAYKWKAPFRAWMLREAVFWRLHDLMTQSYALHQQRHGLGARILLRSGFESLATLIYLNQLMQQVFDGKLDFHLFAEKTTALLVGSRNNEDGPRSLNIVTVLDWMELYGDRHIGSMELCMGTFDHEYDHVWPARIETLEKWIEENDAALESTKNGAAAS